MIGKKTAAELRRMTRSLRRSASGPATPYSNEGEVDSARLAAKQRANTEADLRRKAKTQPVNWALHSLLGHQRAFIDGSRAAERDDAAIAKAERSQHNNGVRRRAKKLRAAEDRRAELLKPRTGSKFIISKEERSERRSRRKSKASATSQRLHEQAMKRSYTERKASEQKVYAVGVRRWSQMPTEHRPRLRAVLAVEAHKQGVDWRRYDQ